MTQRTTGPGSSSVRNVFLAVAVLGIIFSIEYPIISSITPYASINSEDIVVVLLLSVLIGSLLASEHYNIKICFPNLMIALLATSGWIVVTVVVAYFRSPQSIAPSVLWTLKWFEVIMFFFIIQALIDQSSSHIAGRVLIGASLFLIGSAIYLSFSGVHRVRFFFNNPNALAAFFNLAVVTCFNWVVVTLPRRNLWTGVMAVGCLLGIIAVFTTVSRSGLLGLLVTIGSFIALSLHRLSDRQIRSLGLVAGVSIPIVALAIPRDIVRRLIGWVRFTDGGIALANNQAGYSFRTRLRLIEKAFDLFASQPLFGYGWFAVPSRVGYLDVYVTTILVDVGIVGFSLVMLVHLLVLRAFVRLRRQGASVYGTAGVAWSIGLLAQSVGGAFVRSPQILMILFLLLVIAWSEAQGVVYTFD